MNPTKAALAVTLMLGGALPAYAFQSARAEAEQDDRGPQGRPQPQTSQPQAAQPGERQYNTSRPERAALQPLIAAARASDWATAEAALPAAAAAARGNDAKFLVGQVRRLIGVNRQNRQQEAQGIDEMLASGGALPADVPGLYREQLRLAVAMNDRAKQDAALAELRRRDPNDPSLVELAVQLRLQANDQAGANQLLQAGIQQRQAAGQPIPPEWRRQAMVIAYQARQPDTIRLMREYLAVAPTTANWHDGIAIYIQIANADDALKLDLFRLMRAANAMTAEADYMGYYVVANGARLFGEAKTALEEGLQRNLIVQQAAAARERLPVATQRAADDRSSFAEGRAGIVAGNDGRAILSLADVYFTYGQYAEAATVYRAALGKQGADADTVNIRLGAALALAGRRAEAEAAFRAVGAGPRQELAQYWLLWLAGRPA
jgi:hypothetical protein